MYRCSFNGTPSNISDSNCDGVWYVLTIQIIGDMVIKKELITVIFFLVTGCLPASGQEQVMFNLRFESTWSAATHPENFPSNPHFSGLIGTTHNSSVSYWDVGQPASPGIKSMAETGSKTTLISIINDSEDAGRSDLRISEGGIGNSPGKIDIMFTANQSHSLLTLVSMVAPSPDWFVGVSGLPLRDVNGWIPFQEVDLYTYDAGTDSGTSYTSANQETSPASVIERLETEPMLVNGSVRKVGRFIIELAPTLGIGTEEHEVPLRLAVTAFPSPFSTQLNIEWTAERSENVRISVFDLLGRKMETIHNGVSSAGLSRFTWTPTQAPPGVYVVRIESGSEITHQSVVKSLFR